MNTWFLRKPNGDIYGPVEQAELVRWASSDRIAPDDEVSSDRKEWLAAARMPGLKLCWMIEWPDGHRAGPYHVSSLAEMLADGELDGSEAVRHVPTQQTGSLLHTLQTAMLAGELHLAEGTLTAALCGMMRGQTEETLTVTGLPVTAPATQPPETPQVKPATVVVPSKSTHPKDATRIAVPAKRPAVSPTVPVAGPGLATAAQMLAASLTGGTRKVQTLEQQLTSLSAVWRTELAKVQATADKLRQERSAQEEQARQAALEAQQQQQALKTEGDTLREELAALQKSSAATAQQQAAALQQVEVQLKAASGAAEELAKRRTEWEAERGVLLKQRETMQAALDAAQKKAQEQDRTLAIHLDEYKKSDAQWRAELQTHKAVAQRELESKQREVGESVGKLSGLEKDLTALRHQSTQQTHDLRQVREQLAAKQLQLDVAAKQLKDLETGHATVLKQRDAAQGEREAALKKVAEAERLAGEQRKAATQAQQEAQAATAARETAQRALEGVRQELDATTSRLAERDFSLRQAQQQVSKLEAHLVEAEAALADSDKLLDKAEARTTDAEAALEAERESDVLKRAALQQERDDAVERAEERARFCEEISADKRRMEQQLRGELKQAQGARDTALREREEAERALEGSRRRLTEMEERFRQQEQQVRATQEQVDTARQTATAEALRQQAELTTQLGQAQEARQRVVQELQQLQDEHTRQAAELQRLQHELETVQKLKPASNAMAAAVPDKSKAELQRTEAELQQALREQQRLNSEVQAVQADRRQLENDLQRLRRELEDWRQRALAQQAAATPAKPQPVVPETADQKTEAAQTSPAARPAPSSDLYCLPRRKTRDEF